MTNEKNNQEPFNNKEEKLAFQSATQKLTLLDKKFGLDRIKARSEELFLLIIETKKISYELLKSDFDFSKEQD